MGEGRCEARLPYVRRGRGERVTSDQEDPFVTMFELTASLREASAASVEGAAEGLRTVEEQERWLAQNPDLTGEQLAAAGKVAALMTERGERGIEGLLKQARSAVALLPMIDLTQREHVGLLLAEADGFEAMAAQSRTIASGMRVIQEIQWRLKVG